MNKSKKQKEKELKLLKKTRTKQEIRDLNSSKRVIITMDTGTKAFKSPKDYDRKKEKAKIRKLYAEAY